MQEMVKANVPFIFQSHLDDHRIPELRGDKAETHQMLFLKFQWKWYDEKHYCDRPVKNVDELVDKTLANFTLCEDVYIKRGNGFLYTAFGKLWSYSLYSMVIIPKNDEIVEQFIAILSEIVRIRTEESIEEQNLYIKKYVSSLPEFWKKEKVDEFKFTYAH
jgi:hypothetical protein